MTNMHDGDQPQGEFEGSGNASWGEADWANYLHRNDLEVARFLSYYNEIKILPDRLDISARRMGWENADWGPGDPAEDPTDELGESTDLPYCIHQHPVYIVARALGIQLAASLDILNRDGNHSITPTEAGKLMHSAWEVEHQIIMAINATDTGDMSLALVHMKRGLSAINLAIGLVSQLQAAVRLSAAEATADIENTLFDLREICLRVMADCRWDGSRN
jgi:hypothetical protein